ncbi:PPOX class F420-dependent oxidoreductase [Mycobacterium sp. ACS4331]|nr:PPOX class F420-dependent oxidoreductase [Mycobacterium sp. ACS4331]
MSDDALRRFSGARIARLATVTEDGSPHMVPVVFAIDGDVVYTAVDGKPKSTNRLRRLANIERNTAVSVLVDHYEEDWSTLWWVRADGTAVIHSADAVADHARVLLRAKYPQYRTVSVDGPVIAVTVRHWSSWSASQ